jgi:hypothetical protein
VRPTGCEEGTTPAEKGARALFISAFMPTNGTAVPPSASIPCRPDGIVLSLFGVFRFCGGSCGDRAGLLLHSNSFTMLFRGVFLSPEKIDGCKKIW